MNAYRNPAIAVLAGGVGGARLARALALSFPALTVVVNVGDDEEIYGLFVSPDLDTVCYTLAGIEGPQGWGVAGDSFEVMEQLAAIGTETTFRIGDRDMATNLYRTRRLGEGAPLSKVTREIADSLGIRPTVLPATDDSVPTRIRSGARWLSFQEYFVLRRHSDPVDEVEYQGAETAVPAPGVVEAIRRADLVMIAPSNPILSVLPILAIPAIHEAVAGSRRVFAISPLFGNKALKGPAADVLVALGYRPGNQGIADIYGGLITDLVVDIGDRDEELNTRATVHATDTRMSTPAEGMRFAEWLGGRL
jgi:LPPG:FO 2-phospho-L-lactate transferase